MEAPSSPRLRDRDRQPLLDVGDISLALELPQLILACELLALVGVRYSSPTAGIASDADNGDAIFGGSIEPEIVLATCWAARKYNDGIGYARMQTFRAPPPRFVTYIFFPFFAFVS